MTRRLEREFGRFDVDFLDSDEYLSMPRGIRNQAYLYLLALSGRSRKRRTDGVLSRSVANDLAGRMHVSARALLDALVVVELVRVDTECVVVAKYSKWQNTKQEIEDNQRDARERKSRQRHHIVPPPVTTESPPSHLAEKEIEREKEILKAPIETSSLSVGVHGEDPGLDLAAKLHALLGRTLSAKEIQRCGEAVTEFAYMTVGDLVGRANEVVVYREEHEREPLRSVNGFWEAWQRENTWRADQGHPKASQVVGGRTQGMARINPADLLHVTAAS